MKRIFSVIFIFFIIGCTKPYYLHNSYVQYVKEYQLDSICKKEQIPYLGEKWVNGYIVQDKEQNIIKQYSYIRNINTQTHKTEITYICVDLDSMYRLSKRLKIQEK